MHNGQIFNALVTFFEDDEWNFSWVDGLPVLSMPFTGKNGKWMCYAQAREDQEQFVFYSVCPINSPEDKHGAITEFITRANYGMIIGNFEMDYSDGEIRYKTSIDVEGERLTSSLVKQMVYANVIIMDRYIPGIMSVIYGDVPPQEAIAKIEGALPTTADVEDFADDTGENDNNDEEEVGELKENIISDIENIIKAMDNPKPKQKGDSKGTDDANDDEAE